MTGFNNKLTRYISEIDDLIMLRDNIVVNFKQDLTASFECFENSRELLDNYQQIFCKKIEKINENIEFDNDNFLLIISRIDEAYKKIVNEKNKILKTLNEKKSKINVLIKGAIGLEIERNTFINNTMSILERFKDDDVFTCAFITACYTGMRTGEVCSLTWDDIDFENGIINVKHTVYDKPDDGRGRWYMGTTKTKNRTRQIYMSPTLYQALMNFKKKQQYLKKLYGSNYITYYFEDIIGKNGKLIEKRIIENTGNILHMNNANLVFTRPNGKYVGRNILNYPFKIIHKELGIKDCRFYDLRGSYATTNLRNGVEIRDVANILGHKYIETTENFYISSTEEDKKDVTTAFDKVMTSDLINDIIKYEIAY